MSAPRPASGVKRTGWRIRRAAAIAAAILLILLALYWISRSGRQPAPLPPPPVEAPDTAAPADTAIAAPDSMRVDTVDTTARPVKRPVAPKKPAPPVESDTLADTAAIDSPATEYDTLLPEAAAPIDPCAADTVAPWIYPDPSGGLHSDTVRVRLVASEPGPVEWRFKRDTVWNAYTAPITISGRATLVYRGTDTCGNALSPRTEQYDIRSRWGKGMCPDDMTYVEIGETRFCIDPYEWPNRQGVAPQSYISIYQAMDSCAMAGKRLCTAAEWSLACSGPRGRRYPYGDRYEPYACNTADTSAAPTGAHPECRGYFAVFDMSGNLAEWTDTRSRQNRDFYQVAGGFWDSGPRGDCFDTKYSYFPRNRHNPVGFRCCKDSDR
jgi:hypothetical protein